MYIHVHVRHVCVIREMLVHVCIIIHVQYNMTVLFEVVQFLNFSYLLSWHYMQEPLAIIAYRGCIYMYIKKSTRMHVYIHVHTVAHIIYVLKVKMKGKCWHVNKKPQSHRLEVYPHSTHMPTCVCNLGIGDGTESFLFELLSGLLVISQVQLGAH